MIVGDIITYTIVVTNNGPYNAINVRVTDVLDLRLVYIGSNGSQGVYDPVTGVWTIGNLNNGATVTLTITVMVNGIGSIVNVASIIADHHNNSNRSDSVTITATEKPFSGNSTNNGTVIPPSGNSTNNGTDKPINTSLSISVELSGDGKTMFITGRLIDEFGNLLSGKMIEFYVEYPDGSSKYVGSALTDEKGIARISHTSENPFNQGSYIITDAFTGDGSYLPSYNITTLNIPNDKNNKILSGDERPDYVIDRGNTTDTTHDIVSMKKTGIPMNAIAIIALLLILLVVGIISKRKI